MRNKVETLSKESVNGRQPTRSDDDRLLKKGEKKMFAQDWTYDLFMQDAELYRATPIKGVHCRSNASAQEHFMVWFKNCARDFEQEWSNTHEHQYDRYDGWIGDAFIRSMSRSCFSDFYKDTYNQRPHLAWWFYLQAVNFPSTEDVGRTFCASPVEDAMLRAKKMREMEW